MGCGPSGSKQGNNTPPQTASSSQPEVQVAYTGGGMITVNVPDRTHFMWMIFEPQNAGQMTKDIDQAMTQSPAIAAMNARGVKFLENYVSASTQGDCTSDSIQRTLTTEVSMSISQDDKHQINLFIKSKKFPRRSLFQFSVPSSPTCVTKFNSEKVVELANFLLETYNAFLAEMKQRGIDYNTEDVDTRTPQEPKRPLRQI